MNEISLLYLFRLFLRRIVIIACAAVLCAALVFGYCNWFATPIYSASSQLIITNGALIIDDPEEDNVDIYTSKIASQDVQASMYLADVCVSLLETQDIYKELAANFDNKYSYQQLQNNISVALNKTEGIFINISVKNVSAEDAVKIANSFALMAPNYLSDYFPSAKVGITYTADKASLTSPRTVTNTCIGFIVGAAIAFLIVFIIDLNDKTIKGETDFSECYNIPVLGSIPDFENTDAQSGGYQNAVK